MHGLLRPNDHMPRHGRTCCQSRANSAYEEYNRGYNKLK
jgi:hypothetical protein